MAKSDTGPGRRRRGAKPVDAVTKGEAAFDLWLDRGLHTLFDDVAGEPIPEELLRLIEQDQGK